MSAMGQRTGGQVLVDALAAHGADTIFCVPGESYLPALDALYDKSGDIRVITCRQEGGAANMAEAYGKLTGKPGICFVTRGPGAANASIGVHTAFQDSTPMIVLIGQVARGQMDREAFQEIDYRRFYSQVTKWTAQVDDPARLPEYISRAYHTALSGRPGPVALALPEDMLSEMCTAPDLPLHRPAEAAPTPEALAALGDLLEEAKRPLVILGGGGWTAAAVQDMTAFAEANNLPASVSFRRQGLMDNRHPNYVGTIGIAINPKLADRVAAADLIIAVGPRLGEITTGGYTLLEAPLPRQKLVHVHAGAEELGRVYRPDLAINAGMGAFTRALGGLTVADGEKWLNWTRAARAEYQDFTAPLPCPGPVNPAEIFAWLDASIPADSILTNGAGNFSIWLHRFFRYKTLGSQLGPTSGAMGYAVPAAIAAKAVHPTRMVIAVTGDGDFMMTGQELATAVQHDLAVIILVFNNASYGTIRLHQERRFPGRVMATDLVNPDFAALARAYGAHGAVVERTEDFAPAFEAALKTGGPALIEVRLDPEVLTPTTTISGLRKAAENNT